MKRKTPQRQQAVDKIGRSFSLLFNRALMYKTNHPTTVQATGEFHRVLRAELKKVSPIALLFHRDALYVDEDALDPRINVSKIAASFKETGVESLSFSETVSQEDLNLLLDVLTDAKRFPSAGYMKNALKNQGVESISINHVVYRKVTEEETVVGLSEAAVSQMAPARFHRHLIDQLLEQQGTTGGL